MKVLDCVILAAGDGTRMGRAVPKPLIELAGVPLLEHVIERLAVISPRKLFVVIGYKHQLLERFLRKLWREKGYTFEIVTILNRKYGKENGYSLLQAEDLLRERFLLAMADHLVDPEIYSVAAAYEGLGLCVDMTPSFPFQVNDATKVLVEGGKVRRIGKDLQEWNGIDTGVFSMTPVVFEALHYLVKQRSDATLTEAISMLIQWGERVEALDVSGRFWADIDTPLDLELTESLIDRPLPY